MNSVYYKTNQSLVTYKTAFEFEDLSKDGKCLAFKNWMSNKP